MSTRKCTEPGCGKPHRARGYCDMHYRRVRSHGDVHRVDKPGVPARAPVHSLMVECGDCGALLAVVATNQGVWGAIEKHTCEGKR